MSQMKLYKGGLCSKLEVGAVDYDTKSIISRFKKKQNKYDFMNRKKGQPLKVLASYWVERNSTIYLPNTTMDRLVLALESAGHPVETILLGETTIEKLPDFKMQSHIELYVIQKTALNVIKSFDSPMSLLSLQPGGGKTFTSIFYAVERGYPFMVFCKAGYIDQWQEEIMGSVDVKPEDVWRAEGTDSFLKLAERAKEGERPRILLISLSTYRSYVKRWTKGDPKITLDPTDIVRLFGLGSVLSDEVHKEMGALYTMLSLTNVEKVMGLSGTMSTSDPVDNRAQVEMFPHESRFVEGDLKPYIDLIVYTYGTSNPLSLVYSPRGKTSYSHIAYEKWILARPSRISDYLGMIGDAYEKGFVARYVKGDRCLIFVGLRDMAQKVIDYLEENYEDFNYINFTGPTKKEDTDGFTTICSTIGKAGTALDFRGLTTLINTVAVGRPETAIQNIQRLRRPKIALLNKYMEGYMDNRTRLAIQFLNADILTHNRYQTGRNRALRKLIKSKVVHMSPVRI